MARQGFAVAALAALLAACGGGNGGTPTSPSQTSGGSAASGGSGGSGTTASCLPAAPGNLRVIVNGSTRVFNWDAVSSAQDYFIQIGNSSGDSNLVNTNTSQTTYTWTGASPSTYYARVYARNSCGSGANSNEVVFN